MAGWTAGKACESEAGWDAPYLYSAGAVLDSAARRGLKVCDPRALAMGLWGYAKAGVVGGGGLRWMCGEGVIQC